MIHEYKTGRSVCGFVEFCAWAGVIVAAIMILLALGTSTRGGGYTFALAGVVPALTLLIFSFILVVLTQMARATMDGSVAAQKNVIQSNKQHDEMMRALRSYASRTPSAGAPDAAPKPSLADAVSEEISDSAAKPVDGPLESPREQLQPADRVTVKAPDQLEYKGHTIQRDGDKFLIGETRFAELDRAKKHVDRVETDKLEKEIQQKADALRAKRGY